jgi:hypothetical protein
MKRRAGGRALLFIADAEGEVAGVEFGGNEFGGNAGASNARRVIRPSDGLLTEGVSPAAHAELRKARTGNPDSPAAGSLAWAAALEADEPSRVREAPGRDGTGQLASLMTGSLTVRLEPSSRRLIVQEADAAGSERCSEFVAT